MWFWITKQTNLKINKKQFNCYGQEIRLEYTSTSDFETFSSSAQFHFPMKELDFEILNKNEET